MRNSIKSLPATTSKKLAQKIFSNKKLFHKNQAKLPIEKKITILIKLQKIGLETHPKKSTDDKRIVWEL